MKYLWSRQNDDDSLVASREEVNQIPGREDSLVFAGDKTKLDYINLIIAICMQNDFCALYPDRVRAQRKLKLHSGLRFAQRMLGDGQGEAPVDRMLAPALDDPHTFMLIVEDQHIDDPYDQEIQEHFRMFGRHCVVGDDGVLPVGKFGAYRDYDRVSAFTTDALNVMAYQPIASALTAIIKWHELDDPEQVNIMFIGGLSQFLILSSSIHSVTAGIPNPYPLDETPKPWVFNKRLGPGGQVAAAFPYTFSNNDPHMHESAYNIMAGFGVNPLMTDQEIWSFLKVPAP